MGGPYPISWRPEEHKLKRALPLESLQSQNFNIPSSLGLQPTGLPCWFQTCQLCKPISENQPISLLLPFSFQAHPTHCHPHPTGSVSVIQGHSSCWVHCDSLKLHPSWESCWSVFPSQSASLFDLLNALFPWSKAGLPWTWSLRVFPRPFTSLHTLFLKQDSLNFITLISGRPGSTAGLRGLMWAPTLASEPRMWPTYLWQGC